MTNRTLVFLILLGGWVASAGAQVAAVFEGNQTRVCVNSTSGFDANLALLGPAWITSGMDTTELTFNTNGTGTSVTNSLFINHSQLAPGATPAVEGSGNPCNFNYTFDASSGVATLTYGTCVSTVITGPTAGQPSEINGLVSEYRLVDQRTTLVGTSTTPTVERVRNLSTGATFERICHRSSTRFMKR